MSKLMKYEFRKNLLSKLVLLAFTAVGEAAFLLGLFLKWENGLVIGISTLMICGMFGILYVGIESLVTFHRDLNTKQSYMLFLTPRNSFQILGAKVVENGLTIFLTGLFYALLTFLDFTVAAIRIGRIKEFIDVIKNVLENFSVSVTVHSEDILIVFLAILASWIMTLAIGYLAIVLCATVFAGKRLSGLISFVFFLLLSWGVTSLFNVLPDPETMMMQNLLSMGYSFAIALVLYGITGWVMERKLSV